MTKRNNCIIIPYDRLIHQVIKSYDTKNGLWGHPILPEILGQTDPVSRDNKSVKDGSDSTVISSRSRSTL